MGLKKALLLSTLSFSAMAEYRFNGQHPYSIALNEQNEVILKLCYENFTRCTGKLNLGDQKKLNLFIQENIWKRQDVNLENYQAVLKQSQAVVKGHKMELAKREKKVKELSKDDPKIAESLQKYVTDAQIKVRDAQYALNRLVTNKVIVDEVLSEVTQTLKSKTARVYNQQFAYNFEDHEWRTCRGQMSMTKCVESGLHYFITDKKNDFKQKLMVNALRNENQKAQYPQTLASGVQVQLLTTSVSGFGKVDKSQDADAIPSEIGGPDYNVCEATASSGALVDSGLSCSALGKNWRYPSLKELRDNREQLKSILPKMDPQKFLQTSLIKGFMNPGAVHLKICKPVYYNLAKDKTMNNQNEIARDFIAGKAPEAGASAVCVCSENCD